MLIAVCLALLVPGRAPAAHDGVPPERAEARASPAIARSDTLRGLVTDSSGAPLAGAEVVLQELDRKAITGADGRFLIAGVPGARYTVIVRRLGYAPALRALTLPTAQGVTLALCQTALPIAPVTVTATRSPADPARSPLPEAEIGTESLRREHGVSLSHALERVPGVRTLGTGEQVGKPVIRGLGGARVLVLDNGSRLEDYSWSEEDGPSVEARLAERVEVIRGPASVLYGSDAIGGVVNVIPSALPDARGRSPFVRSEVEAYGATNNAEVGTALGAEGARGATAARLRLVARRAEDLRTPDRKLENTGFEALNGEAALGVRGGRGNASVRYARYGGEFKLLEAGGPRATEGEEEGGPERKAGDDRVQLGGNLFARGLRFEARGQWQRHSLAERSDEAGGEPGAESTVFDLLLNTLSLDVLAHHAAGDRLAGTVGLSGLRQTNDTRGIEPVVPDARITSAALFAVEQLSLGRLSVVVGARTDARRLAADSNEELGLRAQRRRYTAFTGDAGAVYDLSGGLALAANVGRAWRAPTLFELYANGPRLGEARFEIGRADLRPEASFDAEVGLRLRRGRVRAEIDAYRNAVSHFTFITPTDSFADVGPDPADSLRVFRYLQATAVLQGGEVSVEADPWRFLALGARYDHVRGRERDSGDPLPLIPPPRGVLSAELHGGALLGVERAYLGGETEIVSRQTRPSPEEREAAEEGGSEALGLVPPGYTLLHVGAGVAREIAGRPFRLDVRVRNAANTRYRNYLNRYKEFALDPGRNVTVRLSVSL